MVDKEKLQKKINLQKTKNIISKIEGIQVNEKKSTMFEFGSDSRDEENYLFDKYPLIQ